MRYAKRVFYSPILFERGLILLAREVKYVTEAIGKIMAEWARTGRKNFIVKVPKSHHIKEFQVLLKQMLNHYRVPVKAEVKEIPVEIECGCGYKGKAKISNPSSALKILCPNCNTDHAKIISGKKIEIE